MECSIIIVLIIVVGLVCDTNTLKNSEKNYGKIAHRMANIQLADASNLRSTGCGIPEVCSNLPATCSEARKNPPDDASKTR